VKHVERRRDCTKTCRSSLWKREFPFLYPQGALLILAPRRNAGDTSVTPRSYAFLSAACAVVIRCATTRGINPQLWTAPVDAELASALRTEVETVADEAEELWGRTLANVRERIMPGARAWVDSTRPVRLHDDTMELAAPSAFAKEWLENRYAHTITEALRETAGRDVRLKVTVDRTPLEEAVEDVEQPDAMPMATQQPAAPPALNPRYLFETFVTGPSNRFAHAAAQAVAEQPARSYNPLFIYGGAGLGKTHLLHAIGHEVHRLYPHATIRYVSSEQF